MDSVSLSWVLLDLYFIFYLYNRKPVILQTAPPLRLSKSMNRDIWLHSLLTGILLYKFFGYCYNAYSQQDPKHRPDDEINTEGWFRSIWNNKAIRRLIALDCNCPCYRSRPKLRFQVHLVVFIITLILRIVAISMYAAVASPNNRAGELVTILGVTFAFLAIGLSFDIYHYCIWWQYTPYLDTTFCCCRSRPHQRYLPYILVGKYRNEEIWGDGRCSGNPCTKRGLEHIAMFHTSKYKPQARWRDLRTREFLSNHSVKPEDLPTYIGFHVTHPEYAVKIAKEGFIPSSRGMLGPGTYFARSLDAANYKVGPEGGRGAWIIAEIRMEKVFEVHRDRIDPNTITNGLWHSKFDTCYCSHPNDNLDEFCIKDPDKQIIRWVMVIEKEYDPKVERLGLDTEFVSTKCWCV